MAKRYRKPEVVFERAARAKCKEVAERIVDHIQNDGLTPVDTGALIASYEAREYETGAEVVTDKHYWKYVEYGTSRQNAQPHVGPAIEAVRNES